MIFPTLCDSVLYIVFDFLNDRDVIAFHMLSKELLTSLPNLPVISRTLNELLRVRRRLRSYVYARELLASNTCNPIDTVIQLCVLPNRIVTNTYDARILQSNTTYLIQFALRQAVASKLIDPFSVSHISQYVFLYPRYEHIKRWYLCQNSDQHFPAPT